jgi:hypothetical protein
MLISCKFVINPTATMTAYSPKALPNYGAVIVLNAPKPLLGAQVFDQLRFP